MTTSQNNILDPLILSYMEDFDSQVQYVLQTVRLKRDEVENLRRLFRDLEYILQENWRGCQILPFGSIVTGLGIRTSDVDCYVSVPEWIRNPGENYVMKAKRLLCRHPEVFQEVFAICTAKVPIVKFFHVPTQRYCDVNFNSPTGVKNSSLIGYLLHTDDRALPLTILIKYWSKVHKLTGTNLLPNYSLTILIIFYLQQKGILPSISLLQETVEPIMLNYWNTAFDNSYDYVSNNHETLYHLLGDFFKYYSTFDFEEFIISPYIGLPLHRELFNTLRDVPDDFGLYKNNVINKVYKSLNIYSKICVQDPFEHARNCTVAISLRLAEEIIANFSHAANSFEKCSSAKFLQEIFLERPPQKPVIAKNHGPKNKLNKIQKHVANETVKNKKLNKNRDIQTLYREINKIAKKRRQKQL